MKLYEFFGHLDLDLDQKKTDDENLNREQEEILIDNIFWFIVDNDKLHKKYFMPAAAKLKKIHDTASTKDNKHDWKTWIPMVNKGCVEYYEKHDVKGDPKDVFNKRVRRDLCKKLVDHYHKDIVNGEYELGH